MKPLRILIAIATLVVLSAAVGACGGDDRETAAMGGADQVARQDTAGGGSGGSRSAMAASEEGYTLDQSGASGAAAMGASGNVVGAAALPGVGPSVIKTADISVEVDEGAFRDAVRDGIAIARRYGGFVLETDIQDQKLGLGSVVLRVPAENFEAALDDMHELGKLKSENISGRDVGQEFVDLEARLRNFQAQETVLLRLMRDSVSVQDTLRVQGHLQQVQLEIEQLRGRINFLRDQTELGTIMLSISEIGAAPPKTGIISRAWERAIEAFLNVIAAIIMGAGFVLPLALMAGLVIFVFSRVRPKMSGT